MENKILSPIVLFTYRRIPNKTIKSLLKNRLAIESELYIFSDGYKNEIDKEDILEVRKYLKEIDGFRKVTIVESSNNKGLANSIIEGVTKVLDEYGKVIVLEDDLIVANDFLEYMHEALEFYENDKKIWSIAGYAPELPCLKERKDELYLSPRASSWGWATWSDRWQMVDWSVADWQEFKKDKKAIERFNLGGNDMYKMLELQMLGKLDSWAIRWCYSQFRQEKYTVYPVQSKVINDGFSDNKGTHNSGSYEKLAIKLNHKAVKFKKLEVKDELVACFKSFHNLSLKTQIGYTLKKFGGYRLAKKFMKTLKG